MIASKAGWTRKKPRAHYIGVMCNWDYMKKIIFTFILIFLISLAIIKEYKSYSSFQIDKQFLESSIKQKLEDNFKIESLSKESFGSFLIGNIHREYKITLPIQPKTNGWKPLPRSGFEKGETLEWEAITDHTGRWGGGFVTVASIAKGEPSILISVYTP